MKKNHYDIFISYRRDGGAQYARILQLMLIQRGYKVFLDYDELKDGLFNEKIRESIKSAPIFLVVLSEGAIDRCINDDDNMRREIQEALKYHKKILPVNPDLVFKGIATEVPAEIRSAVTDIQQSEIHFGQALGVLVDQMIKERIEPVVGPRFKDKNVDQHYEDVLKRLQAKEKLSSYYKLAVIVGIILIALILFVGGTLLWNMKASGEKSQRLETLRQAIAEKHAVFNPLLRNDLSERQLLTIDTLLTRMKPVEEGKLWIDALEFTNGDWADIMGEDCEKNLRNFPVTGKCYYQIIELVRDSLFDMTGIEFDLPSAAEWKFAANGGVYESSFTFSGSNDVDSVAWYAGNSGRKLHPVGESPKIPNYLDLYDMSGNAGELCNSPFVSPDSKECWIVCGGDFLSPATDVKVTSEKYLEFDKSDKAIGFRLIIRK